jgi:hypothetical protein
MRISVGLPGGTAKDRLPWGHSVSVFGTAGSVNLVRDSLTGEKSTIRDFSEGPVPYSTVLEKI